jgi:hypothetical protein
MSTPTVAEIGRVRDFLDEPPSFWTLIRQGWLGTTTERTP